MRLVILIALFCTGFNSYSQKDFVCGVDSTFKIKTITNYGKRGAMNKLNIQYYDSLSTLTKEVLFLDSTFIEATLYYYENDRCIKSVTSSQTGFVGKIRWFFYNQFGFVSEIIDKTFSRSYADSSTIKTETQYQKHSFERDSIGRWTARTYWVANEDSIFRSTSSNVRQNWINNAEVQITDEGTNETFNKVYDECNNHVRTVFYYEDGSEDTFEYITTKTDVSGRWIESETYYTDKNGNREYLSTQKRNIDYY